MRTAERRSGWVNRLQHDRPLALAVTPLILLMCVPLVSGHQQWIQWATVGVIWALWGISLNIIWGYAGPLSLGQFAVGAVSAYTTVILLLEYDYSTLMAVTFGIIAALVVTVFLSLAALRLAGFYFAILTVTIGSLVTTVVANWELAGGTNGLVVPMNKLGTLSLGGWDWNLRSRDGGFYVLTAVILVAAFAFSVHLARSSSGRAMFAIRDDPALAASVGINPFHVRTLAFVISSLVAACAGISQAFFYQFLTADLFALNEALTAILILVVGGIGRPWGPIYGALIYVFLFQAMPYEGPWRAGGLGVAVIAIVIFFPRGIAGLGGSWSRRRFDRQEPSDETDHAVEDSLPGGLESRSTTGVPT